MKVGNLNGIDVDSTYVHPSGNTSERDLLVIESLDTQWFASPINIVTTNLTRMTMFRLYIEIDGVYRQLANLGGAVGTIVWSPGDGDIVQFPIGGFYDHNVKVTIQSALAELASRDVPFSYNAAR